MKKNNITAASANYLLKNGTKNKTAFAINEFFEFYGAYLTAIVIMKLHPLNCIV